MHGLTSVADDDVLHQPPHDVIENRDAEQREAIGPRHEDRSEDHQRDAGLTVEILLNVELIVAAGGALLDDRVRRRRDNGIRGTTSLAWPRCLARFARQSRVTFRTEKVD